LLQIFVPTSTRRRLTYWLFSFLFPPKIASPCTRVHINRAPHIWQKSIHSSSNPFSAEPGRIQFVRSPGKKFLLRGFGNSSAFASRKFRKHSDLCSFEFCSIPPRPVGGPVAIASVCCDLSSTHGLLGMVLRHLNGAFDKTVRPRYIKARITPSAPRLLSQLTPTALSPQILDSLLTYSSNSSLETVSIFLTILVTRPVFNIPAHCPAQSLISCHSVESSFGQSIWAVVVVRH